jgi:hypothetical protein
VFSVGPGSGGWLPALLQLASTREGRLSLLSHLSDGATDGHGEPRAQRGGTGAASRSARPFLVRGGDAPGTDLR